ncbi:hypothetical protein ACHQM5_014472 [Ranunculus cassubicifolius]
MDEFYTDFMKKPAILETFVDILLCTVPIWVAIMIGLIIGWSWRPRWTGLVFLGFRSKVRFLWTCAPPGFGARRLWFAFTAVSAFSVGRKLWFNFKGKRDELDRLGSDGVPVVHQRCESGETISCISPSVDAPNEMQDIVTEKDLDHLLYLLEGKLGDVAWQHMMERTTPSMAYQAWRHEPETGPTIYRSRTVYEDVSPELVRDFFWDDEFRPKWDPMLAHFKTLKECPHTGTTVVHWIKKFPFFCSDREYIIGRRIWESGKTYYCLTKGIPYPDVPKRDKPRRVELYFSSWIIKPVESRKGDGLLSACEVTLVHYEDMGIPKDVAKLGVRHGMWGTVKKVQSGMRAYQLARKCDASLSPSAAMAQITTKIRIDDENAAPETLPQDESQLERVGNDNTNNNGVDWKWVVLGGTVAMVCGMHTGVIGKTLLFSAVARRFGRR